MKLITTPATIELAISEIVDELHPSWIVDCVHDSLLATLQGSIKLT